MSNNRLEFLPDTIGNMKSLRILELDENKIEYIPSDIGYCTNLETLVLTSNKIQQLPTDIGSLKRLRKLLLGENDLILIPPHIGMLESLQEVHLVTSPSHHNLYFQAIHQFESEPSQSPRKPGRLSLPSNPLHRQMPTLRNSRRVPFARALLRRPIFKDARQFNAKSCSRLLTSASIYFLQSSTNTCSNSILNKIFPFIQTN